MFDADDIVWIDFEAAAPGIDSKAAGTFRYVAEASTRALVLAYAVGNAPALTWHTNGAILDWDNAPEDLRAAVDHGALHPIRFYVREVLTVHARCALVGAALA